MKTSTLFVSLSLSILAGCSGMGVGKSDFSCSGLEEGVRCMAATEVYEATEDTDKVAYTHNEKGEKLDAEESAKLNGTEMSPVEKGSNTHKTMETETYKGSAPKVLPKVEYPQPILMPSQVMRIWFGPWEDKAGDLNVGKVIYSELVPRRWTLDDVDLVPGRRTFVPLNIQ